MSVPNATVVIPAEAIPIINGFTESIKPAVIFLMVGTVFPTILLAMLVALCYLSTETSRRRPIFILNILDLLLGIATGIWNDYIEASALHIRVRHTQRLTQLSHKPQTI